MGREGMIHVAWGMGHGACGAIVHPERQNPVNTRCGSERQNLPCRPSVRILLPRHAGLSVTFRPKCDGRRLQILTVPDDQSVHGGASRFVRNVTDMDPNSMIVTVSHARSVHG